MAKRAKRATRLPADEDPIARNAERLGAGQEIRQLGLAEIELGAGAERRSVSAQDAAAVAAAALRLSREWAGIALGRSTRVVPAKDPRFSDPAWRDNPLYRRVGQAYLAFCDAVDAPRRGRRGLEKT